jgi:SAM-dependent methyltransferase
MTPGLVEYVALRLARRFLMTDGMLKHVGGLLPYYRTNLNEVDARPVIALYERAIAASDRQLPPDPVILEVGSGATNSVGYALAQSRLAAGGRVVLFEPFVPLDEAADARQRSALAPGVTQRVQRISTLQGVAAGSVDLVLSHSVLEHVRDPASTLAELDRVMAPSGLMVHAVDYRDHFFKYPFHFLLFSRRSWERWLDPGDLPRWRLGDHLGHLRARGLRAEVLDARSLPDEFAKVAARIHPDFDLADPNVEVAQATLLVSRGA